MPCEKIIRRRIIDKGLRVDGRNLDEVRPLYCESGIYPMLHGSSLFSRGDTQVRSFTLNSVLSCEYLLVCHPKLLLD